MKDWRDYKLAIAISMNQHKMDRQLMWAVMNLHKPHAYCVLPPGSQHVKAASLNQLLQRAIENRVDKILFLDADMDFPARTIPQLLSHDMPIVSGLYHIKEYPYAPVAGWNGKRIRVNGNGVAWKTDYCPLPKDELVEVHWTGVGCLMVDMDVFNHIPYPPFRDKWDRKRGHRRKGHDIIFGDDVRKAGYKIYVDTSIDCGHRTVLTVNRLWVETYHELGMEDRLFQKFQEYATEPGYWNEIWQEEDIRNRERYAGLLVDRIVPEIPEGATIADFGCGDGGLLRHLQSKGYDVYGYDFSKNSIAYINRKGIPGEVADIRTFTPNGADHHTVVCAHVFEHLEDGYEERAAEILSKLATDQVFITVPEESKGQIWWEHKRHYTRRSLRKILKPYFKSVEIARQKRLKSVIADCDLIAHCMKH